MAAATNAARSRFVRQPASLSDNSMQGSITYDKSVNSALAYEQATSAAIRSAATMSGSPGPLSTASIAAHPAPIAELAGPEFNAPNNSNAASTILLVPGE